MGIVIIGLVLIVGVILLYVFLSIQGKRRDTALLQTVTDTWRGTWSEQALILKLLKQGVPAVTVFHDLYIEKRTNQYAQIDAVILTKVGIIVFEVKDYSGWIFGKGYQDYWTQVLAYGKERYRFYNPIMQNKRHIEALRWKLSGIADVPFYSVIIFYGPCTLRDVSCIPEGTYVGYSEDIMSIVDFIIANNLPADYQDKWGVINVLKEATSLGNNPDVVSQHIQNIYNCQKSYSRYRTFGT